MYKLASETDGEVGRQKKYFKEISLKIQFFEIKFPNLMTIIHPG